MEEKKKEEEEEEEEDEELLEINMQPWTDEEIQRVLEMEKKGGLTEEEREWCKRWCCGDQMFSAAASLYFLIYNRSEELQH